MATDSFRGPVFIVGMPRSGTKLLRALLNRHPEIRIPGTETDFLPYWVKNWSKFGDLESREAFSRFYDRCCRMGYMRVARGVGVLIGRDEWYRRCRSFGPAGVFEALLRHDLKIEEDTNIIWGDKTPSYIAKTSLLSQVYPEAKFIHIVRDVRDFAMSLNKAWNKNIYRAAQRWSDDVMAARKNGESHGRYAEVKYEDLLDDTERELRRICRFLEREYVPEMRDIDRPCENTAGDAKGVSFVKRDNQSKYEAGMPAPIRKEVEAITRSALIAYGYPVDQTGPRKKLGRLAARWYEIKDGMALIRRGKIQNLSDIIVNANRQ